MQFQLIATLKNVAAISRLYLLNHHPPIAQKEIKISLHRNEKHFSYTTKTIRQEE